MTGFYGRDHPIAGNGHSRVIVTMTINDLIELDMAINANTDVDIDCGICEENAVSN